MSWAIQNSNADMEIQEKGAVEFKLSNSRTVELKNGIYCKNLAENLSSLRKFAD